MRRAFHDPLDIAILQGRSRHELRRCTSGTDDIYPIQHQHVEMRIEIQCAAKALDKGNRAALDGGVALRSGLLAIPGLDGTEKHCQESTDERAVVG